ncbi:hypothetical protein FXF51_60100, partial [Nonomuraea sp. PA05]
HPRGQGHAYPSAAAGTTARRDIAARSADRFAGRELTVITLDRLVNVLGGYGVRLCNRPQARAGVEAAAPTIAPVTRVVRDSAC